MLSKMSGWKFISMKQLPKYCNYVGLTASQSDLLACPFVEDGFDASVSEAFNYQN